MHHTAAATLRTVYRALKNQGIRLVFAEVSADVRAKLDRYRPTARIALEPWLVEKALERLGNRRLSREEQETVVKATRTPKRVRWPEWWEVLK